MAGKLSLFLVAVLMFVSFVVFSYFVARDRFTQSDFDTTVKLQNHISRRFDLPFSVFSLLGSSEVTVIIWLVIFMFVLARKFWLTAVASLTFFVSFLFELFGKLFVEHPGPPFLFYRGVLHFNFPSHYVHTNFSYPSGHITRTAFLTVFLILLLQAKFPFYLRTPIQIFLAAFLVTMIVSRVYLGEHWTSDVVGGMLLGSSLAFLSAVTVQARKNHKSSTALANSSES